jgi:hypothetical protein
VTSFDRGAGALPPSNPPAPLPSIDRKTEPEVFPMMTPREYSAQLSSTRHGPHDDDTTTAVAAVTGEAIRWLAYATRPGADGVTSPATVYDLAIELNAAINRIPQVLSQLADWLGDEDTAGQVTSDSAANVDDVRTALGDAMTDADRLARALANVTNLTAALRPAEVAEVLAEVA